MLRGAVALLVPVAALAAALSANAAPPAAPAAPAAWRSSKDVLEAADKAKQRLELLVQKSSLSPAVRKIRTYRGYSREELADVKRRGKEGVGVDDLLDIVANLKGENPVDVREDAANAIIDPKTMLQDVELSTDGRRLSRPRAVFSLKVVKLLSSPDDVLTRGLAHKVLTGLWSGVGDPAIRNYDPRRKETWGPAREAWKRILEK